MLVNKNLDAKSELSLKVQAFSDSTNENTNSTNKTDMDVSPYKPGESRLYYHGVTLRNLLATR
jgi:hypothetical protein